MNSNVSPLGSSTLSDLDRIAAAYGLSDRETTIFKQLLEGRTIARIAQDCGIAALAVHGRTRDQHYTGMAEYDTVAAIKAALSIPVLANGDIDSPEKAAAVLRQTGCDGVLVGRAAQGRPWIFREIAHHLATGERLPPPHDFDDAAWVGARYTELLPIPLLAKQKLLELDDPISRLEILQKYLREHGLLPNVA